MSNSSQEVTEKKNNNNKNVYSESFSDETDEAYKPFLDKVKDFDDKYYCLPCDPKREHPKKCSGLYGPNRHLSSVKHEKNIKK